MSVLRETNEQILAGIRHRWKSDAERRRMAEPIRLIDGLIADLEELHLTDRKRVPPSYEGRLMHLTAVLPPEVRQELRDTGVTAVNVHPGGINTNIVRNARFTDDANLPFA